MTYYCRGCEQDKDEKDFSPSQITEERMKINKSPYCKKCYHFAQEHGHFPKYFKEKEKYVSVWNLSQAI